MKIGVVLGSTRKARRGERVAKWLMSELRNFPGIDFELLDLREYPLPFYEEDTSPDSLENGYTNPVATKWAAKIGEMDGFIFIVGEYNHGPIPVLLNAIDYVYNEWNKKPVVFVSYSTSATAGARAVEQLRAITSEVEMAPMQAAIHIGDVESKFDENGTLLKGHYKERLPVVMEQFLWWANTLKNARDHE